MIRDHQNASLEPTFLEPIPEPIVEGFGTGFECPPLPAAVDWAMDWFARHRCPFIPEWEAQRMAMWPVPA